MHAVSLRLCLLIAVVAAPIAAQTHWGGQKPNDFQWLFNEGLKRFLTWDPNEASRIREECRQFEELAEETLGNVSQCKWQWKNDFPRPTPLLFSVTRQESVLPVKEGSSRVVTLDVGEPVYVACPGSKIVAVGDEAVSAICASGNKLNINLKDYDMSQLGCASTPKESIVTKIPGPGKEMQSEIGFQMGGFGFYPLISVSFDPDQQTNLYSRHTVRGASISDTDTVLSRPGFKKDTGFFKVSPDACYEQKSQKNLFQSILKIPSVFDVRKCRYFAKGHLAPDADFVTEMEQKATYHYINAVPQWQFFNNKNWKCLEYRVRKLANKRKSNINVYTGTWQVLELPDLNSNMAKTFLGLTESQQVIPAPLVMWKVVHDPTKNAAVAVVGVNSPDVASAAGVPCSSSTLCDRLNWFHDFNFDDTSGGRMFCCTVDDLKKDVPYVPNLGPVGLLTD